MKRRTAVRWIAKGAGAAAVAAVLVALPLTSASAADNLSLSGGADGSSKAGGTSYGDVKDGSTSTYWSPAGATGFVSVKWSSATTVSSAVIVQASGGGSISAWRLLNADTGAVLTSGSGSPSTISFSSTSLKKLTLDITGASSAPRIAEFETYAGGSSTPTSSPTASPTSNPGTTLTVAADGSGQYATVQAAVNAVAANNASRVIINIKAGTYREIVSIPSNKPYITLNGTGSGPSNVVIVNNRSNAGGYGTFGSATVTVAAKEFIASNLTFANDYGTGSQAVAINMNGDKGIYRNVRFLGNQDTLLANTQRQYIVNSYVEGTVDFIFGDAVAVFNATSIYEKRSTGGPLTAARTPAGNTYGFLIYKCTITGATNNTTQLGRPWGPTAQVLFRESSLSATIATQQPWIDMSGNVWQNARFSEYKNTGSGASTNSNRPQMSDSTAANYTPQKYLAGSDGWNPIG
jgi:pectin methylesterase-like acyl-CoA thioesterase